MTDSAVKKELPVGTIMELSPGQIVLKLELGDTETTATYKTTQKVEEFLSNPKYAKLYHRGAVVEFSAHNGVVSLVRVAKGFSTANVPNTASVQPTATGTIVPMNTVTQAASTFVTPAAKPSAPPQQLSLSGEAVKFIGSFDPAKVHGYTVKDTCQMVQFEPLTIEVTADDIETCRRALIDAWQVFGQHHEIVRETVQKHVERVLLRL